MRHDLRRALLAATCAIAPVAASAGLAHAATAPSVTPVTGPAGTHPYNASAFQRTPLDLSTVGYTEREYLLGGTASAYQYANPGNAADDSVAPFGTPVSYTNRILVRAPSDPSKFSGNVVVELLNDNLVADNTSVWAVSEPYIVGNGDAWVGLTSAPSGIASLKSYAPARYTALTWPQTSGAASCSNTAAAEPGLIFDQLTQLGTLLKQTSNPANPLAGYAVGKTFVSGYSGGASTLLTYDRVFGLNSSLFDGYLLAAGGFRAALNVCESSNQVSARTAPARSTVVPVMQIQTASELTIAAAFMQTIPSGTDSDASDNRYRRYDIAGTAHVNGTLYYAQPQAADLAKSGGTTFTLPQLQSVCGDPAAATLTTFPDHYAYDAIWSALEKWSRNSTVPPHATRLTLTNSGYPIGGWRTPAVDVPTQQYTPGMINVALLLKNNSAGTLCALTGYQQAIPSATLSALYPTQTAYARKVASDAQTLQTGGFLTQADAAALITNPSAR